MRTRIRFALAALLAGLVVLAGAPDGLRAGSSWMPGQAGESGAVVRGGDGTMYIGGWPDKIYILDEATEKVSGSITMQTGAPRAVELSHDRTRFYVRSTTLEDIEIVDIAGRKVVDRFKLSEGLQKVRIFGLAADPRHRFLVLVTVGATRQLDRYEIGPTELVVYDLASRKISREIPWPDGEERLRPNLMLSPDGQYLYVFSDDVLIYETAEFKQVDKWELSRPLEDGLGAFDFGGFDTTYEEPGFFTTLFYTQDPIQKRQIMGIARINLPGKRVEFYPLGPAQRVGFALAPGRKQAFGLRSEIGRYEFWGFDLESRRVSKRVEFEGRPRMSLRVSSNGKLLYIWQAGNTIDLHDAATFKHLRRITLDFDNTSALVMVPRDAPGRQPTAAAAAR
jgi:hypothetical protein